jgi:alanine racemase
LVAAELGLDTVVHCAEQLSDFITTSLVKPVKTWLKVDTGMHRLGVQPEQVAEYVRKLSGSGNVLGEVNFVSHFSSADDVSSSATTEQLARFISATAGYPGERTLANSAGILNWQGSHFDWVRAGISLYGIAPDEGKTSTDYGLKPVMTLQSKLIAVREHQAGEPVGYSQTWTAPKMTRIGVVAMGYGDGYPRLAPVGTPVWVNGREVPIVGRVSMDMITVDLGADATDKVGDRVEFWGNNLAVERVSEVVGTIPYELTIKLASRVVKTYTGDDV